MNKLNYNEPVRKMKGVASTKVGRNGFSDAGGWQLYHTDCLRFRKRAETNSKKAIAYGTKSEWINVSNNVITAPPSEVSYG